MRFVHTADLHIGGSRSLPLHLERQESALDQIFDVAYEQDIDVVVIAGDVFDVSEPTLEERDLVERKLLEYDAQGFHILVIPGNHDLVDASGYTALHYLSMLSELGRLKNSVVTEVTRYVQIRDTVFCLLVHGRGDFNDACSRAVRDYHESGIRVDANNFVMVCHETIRGSQTDIKLKSGDYFRLDSGVARPDESLDVTYWALGDIHKMQAVGPRAFYSGAPLQIKFGDDWPKGVLVVDTEDPTRPKFAPIDTNQLVKISPGQTAPPNSYVKYSIKNKADVDLQSLPENVVRVEISSPKAELSLDVNSSLREKLIEGISQQGAEGQVLKFALSEIDSLMRTVDQ